MNAESERADFSIVTAVRNAKATIEHCIRSIDEQKSVTVQHIVVDACSTDGTSELIAKHARSGRTHICEKDRGISDAWNKGLRLCTGKYVGILSADDYYTDTTLALVKAALDVNPSLMYYGDIRLVSPSDPNEVSFYRGAFNKRTLFRGIGFWHPTLFGSWEIFQKVGEFNLAYRIAGDCEWIIRANALSVRFDRHEGAVFMRRGGLSDVNWLAGRKEYATILESHRDLKIQALMARAWNQYLKLKAKVS
jgi:glycosyltransferase involved in cell wall biosynthesis